jgi:hypothetical protein
MTNTDPNESIAVWDLAPDSGGRPNQFQAARNYAIAVCLASPERYRLVEPGDVTPTERSDGKPIIPEADQ